MAVNPDPKPGRWILPLVVLGMIAFTFFFVRALPEASTDSTLAAGPSVTTSTTVAGGNGSPASTTTPTTNLDPAVQAYLDEVDAVNAELQVQRTDLVTVNEAFNQDPREIEFPDAESRFESILAATGGLRDRIAALTPPAGLEPNQTALQAAIDLAVNSITEALEGLRSTDTGERRNAAVEAYVQATIDFGNEVTNTHNAATG